MASRSSFLRGMATLMLCAVLFQTRRGSAQQVERRVPTSFPSTLAPTSATVDPRSTAHPRGGLFSTWNVTRPRWFLSARADVGFLFFRPRVSLGHGIPHQKWFGIDLVPIFSSTHVGGYAGARIRTPRFEFRSGMLYSAAFFRGALPKQSAYDERDLDRKSDDPIRYWAIDSELTLSLPVGKSFVQSETQVLYLPFADRAMNVFVEPMGVIVSPPWGLRSQLRGSFPVAPVPGLFVGPAVELLLLPGRSDPWVARAGGTITLSLYQDVQLRTDILPAIWSIDTTGRLGSPWLTVNIRIRWATD